MLRSQHRQRSAGLLLPSLLLLLLVCLVWDDTNWRKRTTAYAHDRDDTDDDDENKDHRLADDDEHHDCGTAEPTLSHVRAIRRAEYDFLGGTYLRNMTSIDFSNIFQSLLDADGRGGTSTSSIMKSSDYNDTPTKFLWRRKKRRKPFRLVNVPIVYHVLPNQGRGKIRPSLTDAQREYSTQYTNKLYNIYDRQTKQSVQFVSFVTDRNLTVTHDDIVTTRDCLTLPLRDLARLVRRIPDWQYKMHAIVCEFRQMSGVASSPLMFRPTHPFHNLFRMDHRALACIDYDDRIDNSGTTTTDTSATINNDTSAGTGNATTVTAATNYTFLCHLSDDGQAISKARWWRSRSAVLAHEMGHLFGLFHTFTGGCVLDDLTIRDTPAESRRTGTFGCPGLLPYDKNRNLMDDSSQNRVNAGASADTCLGGVSNVCPVGDSAGAAVSTTCAACCVPEPGQNRCAEYSSRYESISESMLGTSPDCCTNDNSRPVDSCPLRRGLDPLNNIMSYAPDFCMHEFTPGQMMSMMLQIRYFKKYMYCNYANVKDRIKCWNVPCYQGATSPNCVS